MLDPERATAGDDRAPGPGHLRGHPRRRPGRIALEAAGTILLTNAGVYLHTTLRGKLRVWERELDRAACGVTSDCWTWAAAAARCWVEVHTGNITALPFADGSFDVVTGALAIHNIRSAEGRYRAVDEAMRVLRPGGQLLIADPWPMTRKYAAHIGHGTLRGLGSGYWYGGPWVGIAMLHAGKERQPAGERTFPPASSGPPLSVLIACRCHSPRAGRASPRRPR
ncbi:MAG: class I SAM-dependent methyltransferase [Streptosporangiaceae bacterium]